MARRKEPKIPDAILDQLLAGADPKTAFDPNGLLDELKKALAEWALNAEMDHHLANGEAGNSRNGYGKKTGDCALDLVAERRMGIVETLIESELVVETPADLLERLRLHRERECVDAAAEARIYADLERIVAAGAAHPSTVDISSSVHRRNIEAAIKANPARPDRSIARELHCSPTTVGRVRAAIGLAGAPRSVQRRGQMFRANYRIRGGAPSANP